MGPCNSSNSKSKTLYNTKTASNRTIKKNSNLSINTVNIRKNSINKLDALNLSNEEYNKYYNSLPEEFKDMPYWEGEIYVNEGVKKDIAYKCNLKVDELTEKRLAFKTYLGKSHPAISYIKSACESNYNKASKILNDNNIKIISKEKNLKLLYVSDINKVYRIPNWFFNEPYNKKILLEDNYIGNEKDDNIIINVYLLDVYDNKKKLVEVNHHCIGSKIKDIFFIEFADKHKCETATARIIFRGSEVKDFESLYMHQVKNKNTLQVVINKII